MEVLRENVSIPMVLNEIALWLRGVEQTGTDSAALAFRMPRVLTRGISLSFRSVQSGSSKMKSGLLVGLVFRQNDIDMDDRAFVYGDAT